MKAGYSKWVKTPSGGFYLVQFDHFDLLFVSYYDFSGMYNLAIRPDLKKKKKTHKWIWLLAYRVLGNLSDNMKYMYFSFV